MTPTVSVIIPVFNGAAYVGAAIDSVLRQEMDGVEVVVVDDGSTDATPDVLRTFGTAVRPLRQENQGVARARNAGAALGRGQYLAFLDADDLWRPGKLARQLGALAEQPSAQACATAFEVVDDQLRPLEVRGGVEVGLDDLLLRGNLIGTPSTVMVERGLFEAVGGFDPALSQCADWDLWIRLRTRTRLAAVREPLVLYRSHPGNMSRSVPLLETDGRRVLEKAFAMDLPEELRDQRKRAFAANDMVLAGSYFHAGRRADAMRCAIRALGGDWRQAGRLAGFPFRAGSRSR